MIATDVAKASPPFSDLAKPFEARGVFDQEMMFWQFCSPKQQTHRLRAPNSLGQRGCLRSLTTPTYEMTLGKREHLARSSVGKRAHLQRLLCSCSRSSPQNLSFPGQSLDWCSRTRTPKSKYCSHPRLTIQRERS